jgi:hypothetical protein
MNLRTLLTLVVLSSSASAWALPHPCTPTVPARPTRMTCISGNTRFQIVIQTLMSPPAPRCREHIEFHTATIEISTLDDRAVGTLELLNGQFDYELRTVSNSLFEVPALNLRLENCRVPLHGGGMSIGN